MSNSELSSLAAEEAVLGGLLVDSTAFARVVDTINVEDLDSLKG